MRESKFTWVFIICIVFLVACTSHNSDEIKNKKITQVYEDCFIPLSKKVSKINFNDSKSFFESLPYEYEITEPNLDTNGYITVKDENGFQLTLWFYKKMIMMIF